MRWLLKSRLRLRSLLLRSRVEHELEDELRDYLDREIEREMAAGSSAEEARRRALSSLRGASRLKEECRDARRVRWFEDGLNDLRFACRTLRKAPAFTLTTIAALAFCIGLNAAIFSVVDTVLFRPLPFPDQDRLVSATEGVPALGYPALPFTCPDYLFVAANNRSFAAAGVYRTEEYEFAGAGQPRRIKGARLSPSIFQVLETLPSAGRAFTQREDDTSARVAVLNDGFAQSLFGTPQRALGRTVFLDRIPYQVIGIMPQSFSFPVRGSRFNDNPAELFIPVSWTAGDRKQTLSNYDYSLIARLRPGVKVQQANAEVRSLINRIVANYPTEIKQIVQHLPHFSLEARVIPFREEFTGNVQRPLLLLMAAVAIVLLIGCSDVANLMFSRMLERQREFAMRTALGASLGRLVRQTLTEGLLLSAAGAAIGLCLARWTIPLLVRLAPDSLPRLGEVALNWPTTAFVLATAFATPLLFCLGPFLGAIRSGIIDQLRGEGRTNTRGKRERFLMSSAVILQFSLAFLLLTTAGLLLRSFLHASSSNPGFQPEHLVSMRIALPDTTYKTPSQIKNLFDRLLAQLSKLPGVQQVGAISDLPMSSTSNVIISAQNRGSIPERVDTLFCIGNALASLRVSLLRGRLLGPEDYVGKPHAVVISEGLANRVWPHDDPIGKRLKFGVDDPMNDQPWLTVVGLIADPKAKLTSQSPRLAVFTTPENWVDTMNVLVRTSGDPAALASVIRLQVSHIDPDLPTGAMKTVNEILGDSLGAERFRTWLLASFAITAMLLATLGIAGLLAYNAAQRMQEFGIRVALGANRRYLLALILGHCLRLSGAGVTLGLAASLIATRALSAFLYDTSPFDLGTFAAVSLILMLVAFAAAILPAWRVMRVDPALLLRAT